MSIIVYKFIKKLCEKVGKIFICIFFINDKISNSNKNPINDIL